jgi:hypothetical protein
MQAHGNRTPPRAVPVTWAQPAGNVRPFVRRPPEDTTSEVTLLRSEIAVMRDEAAERDDKIEQLRNDIAAHLVTIEQLERSARKRGPYKKRTP